MTHTHSILVEKDGEETEVTFGYTFSYYYLEAKTDALPENCYPTEEEFEAYLTAEQRAAIPTEFVGAVEKWFESKNCYDISVEEWRTYEPG